MLMRTANSPAWPQGFEFHLPVPQGNAFGNLARSAGSNPDRPALFYYGAETSYRSLLEQAEALAGFLQQRCDVHPGDRVLIDMQNSPQFVVAFQAVLRADAVVIPVNPMNVEQELAHYISDSGARVALIGDELIERFLPFAGSALNHVIVARYADAVPSDCSDPLPEVMLRRSSAVPRGPFVDFRAAVAHGLTPAPMRAGSGDIAVMPYTSGTTGRPKACMHTHNAVTFTAAAQAKWYGLNAQSVMTSFMPLFHVAGMQASMSAGLQAGAALVLMTRWNRDLIPALFRRHKVSWWSAAPTMIVDVLSSERFSDDCFAHLKVLTGGGASMPAAIAAKLKENYGLDFCEGYGLSETISATHINPPGHAKPQCLGIPIFDTRSMIVDPATLRELGEEETGEILVSGPQVMLGYWNRPEADAETFVEMHGRRWLRTGDMGRRDAEGYYFISDRLKRMINVSGFKVWPAECEALLYRHPDVQECVVIAAPDGYRGETVKALITLRPAARGRVSADDIIAFARTVMAAYKAPRIVEFHDDLPRTGSTKIDWRKLQEAEWARLDD